MCVFFYPFAILHCKLSFYSISFTIVVSGIHFYMFILQINQHYSKPRVTPVEVLPVFPDFKVSWQQKHTTLDETVSVLH